MSVPTSADPGKNEDIPGQDQQRAIARAPHGEPFARSPPPSFIPIPSSSSMQALKTPAGPSSEGAVQRHGLSPDTPVTPISPSSAPPVPSVIAVTHPSLYIHTHHPRRGSMTPLGLHVISPVPPTGSPVRSIGFAAQGPGNVDPGYAAARRGSAASTCSTLTQSRPINQIATTPNHPHFPPGFNRERRRSSLTPSLPSLAAPSPSRTHASGRFHSRPSSSDGSEPAPPPHVRTRTAEHPRPLASLNGSPLSPNNGRRGSLPQLNYGGWNGPTTRTWNPSLPPQRASVSEDAPLPDEGFKFGTAAAGPSTAAAALKSIDLSPGSRRGSVVSAGKKKEPDVFEEAEAQEAERQRNAFLAATYGQDGKRARERLSFAGSTLPGATGPSLRRQSLMLWEKLNTASAAHKATELQAEGGPISAPHPTLSSSFGVLNEEHLGPRRGSLPLAIPGSGVGRSPSRLKKKHDIDAPPKIVREDEDGSEDEEEDEEEEELHEGLLSVSTNNNLDAPQRPLPPLLPLSDPGPRLLPSTLALHRANHLLNARGLEADPLPHPLPPSLHPPAPVDLAEFDIDFILAGSQAQLGGESASPNDPVDIYPRGPLPITPTFQLGAEEEDSFAKFVGAFDDEYGGRRGEWTFRACPPKPFPQESASQDPFDTGSRIPRAEWDCQGAGRYELFADGEVRSVETNATWRVRRTSTREYELERVSLLRPRASSSKTDGSSNECHVIASKLAHSDQGGIKIPSTYRPITLPLQPPGPPLRVSISDSIPEQRNARLGSTDSSATARASAFFAQSLPQGGITPRKNRQPSRGDQPRPSESSLIPPLPSDRSRASISGTPGKPNDLKPKEKRSESKEPEEEKKKGGFGGALKRAFKNTIAANDEKKAAKEERDRERMQSQSWSPSVPRSKDYIHPSGRGYVPQRGSEKSQSRTSPAAISTAKIDPRASLSSSRNPSDTSSRSTQPPRSSHPWLGPAPDERDRRSPKPPSGDETPFWRQGKAWAGVPDEAVAMVIPVEGSRPSTPSGSLPSVQSNNSAIPATRQALLVWFVPFNSGENDDRPATAVSSASSRMSSEPSTHINLPTSLPATQLPINPSSAPKHGESPSVSSSTHLSSSLPKFQKLLRRRASKDKDALKREREGLVILSNVQTGLTSSAPGSIHHSNAAETVKTNCALIPLPFRSFRVVARMVEIEDLRSEPTQSRSSSPVFANWKASQLPVAVGSSTSSNPSPSRPPPSLPSTSADENSSSSFSAVSTAPTSSILAGRTFPTVIAVCHSRSQGVEFVLEGLDRLGFCQGESAWGPTGYEEWRGSGLSDKGRELLDLLWAGCAGVMGLMGV